MHREEFEKEVDSFLCSHILENVTLAKLSALVMYHFIFDKASGALKMRKGSLYWCDALVQIQCVMSYTALCLFSNALAQDELLPIRAAAKGNLLQTQGLYLNDSEAHLMVRANQNVMMSQRFPKLQQEIFSNRRLKEAVLSWDASTQIKKAMEFKPEFYN
jgi:hypothetical protein